MRVLCAGGGTAGHVYPVLAILGSLRRLCAEQGREMDAEWLGHGRGMSRELVEAAGLRHRQVSSGQIRAVNPAIQIASIIRLGCGVLQSLRHVIRYRPHLCLASGGYAAAPGAIAACLLRVPLLLFMPDAAPGITDRLLIRFARSVLTTSSGALAQLRGKGVVTGYPVRDELVAAARDRGGSRRRLQEALGLPADGSPLLLVVGGSLGARSLNEAILDCLPWLLERCHILLIAGRKEEPAVRAKASRLRLSSRLTDRLRIVPYLHEEFAAALSSADLAVMRAGASVLGELPVCETPAVLVPLPGSGGHQWANANFLARQGGCLVLDNGDLPQELGPMLRNLLEGDADRLRMRESLRGLARTDGALRNARAILKVVTPSGLPA